MGDLEAAGNLHHVEGADDVAVDIFARGFKGIAHPGLCREVDDHLGFKGVGHAVQRIAVLQLRLDGGEVRVLQQDLVAALFQADVVIVRHAVKALHPKAFVQQQPRQMKADEPCCAGNQNLAHVTLQLAP